jgi:hypothetical protein
LDSQVAPPAARTLSSGSSLCVVSNIRTRAGALPPRRHKVWIYLPDKAAWSPREP